MKEMAQERLTQVATVLQGLSVGGACVAGYVLLRYCLSYCVDVCVIDLMC